MIKELALVPFLHKSIFNLDETGYDQVSSIVTISNCIECQCSCYTNRIQFVGKQIGIMSEYVDANPKCIFVALLNGNQWMSFNCSSFLSYIRCVCIKRQERGAGSFIIIDKYDFPH